jgi:RNA polymerase sigma factor (sigma-70 family)
MLTRTSTILLEGLKDSANGAAWQEFDVRYRPLLMAVARRLGLAEDDAEDSVQETMTAFTAQHVEGRYRRDKGRLRDWLCGIMTHKARDIQRRQLRHRPTASQGADPIAEIGDASVQAAMEAEWSNAVLRQCLEEIRQEVQPKTFETFELFVLKQWPAAQTARRCGVSVDVVYQNKRRILQRIRELLPGVEEIW